MLLIGHAKNYGLLEISSTFPLKPAQGICIDFEIKCIDKEIDIIPTTKIKFIHSAT